MPRQTNQLNLLNMFKSVSKTLTQNRQDLNQADTYNHDHGDNMVEVFNVITQAMQAKKNADPADQLAYASQLLRQKKSGSAQLYSQGLSQASKEFQGQGQVTTNNAMKLIQALMGTGQSASSAQPQGGAGDLIGMLLGGGASPQPQSQQGTGDLLGALLGGGSSQAQPQGQQPGVDLGDLLNAGMAFMNTKSQGGNNMEAIVNAVVAGSAMSNSTHRTQSGNLVVNALLNAIGSKAGKK